MMREFVQNISGRSRYVGIIEWVKLFAITGSAQVVVQGIGLVSGILIIRLLSTEEYALYTVVNIMVGTMTILADGGISTGIIREGGKVWEDRQKLGAVLSSGLNLRNKFALGSLIIAAPILFVLLRHHGASLLMSILLLIALIPAFLTALSASLLEIGPKLQQDIAPLQKIQVGVNVGRLTMLSVSLCIFPWAFVAILAGGLPQFWGNKRLLKISAAYADSTQKPDPAIQKAILNLVKRILPTAIYFCISGQITIWLVSFLGSTTSIAQIGALGRLAMGLSIFNILFATLLTPRFARLPEIRSLLIKRYTQLQIGVIGLCICIITAAWLFHSQVLWILGSGYQDLRIELLLNIVGSCLTLIAGISFTLYTSRGWVIKPAISIPINISIILIGILMLDISTLKGILLINILIAFAQVIMNGAFISFKMIKVKS
jgi:O-antigen/teichoic acid export membrane protein